MLRETKQNTNENEMSKSRMELLQEAFELFLRLTPAQLEEVIEELDITSR